MKIYRVEISDSDNWDPHLFWTANRRDAEKYAKEHDIPNALWATINEIHFMPTKKNILNMMNRWAREHHH